MKISTDNELTGSFHITSSTYKTSTLILSVDNLNAVVVHCDILGIAATQWTPFRGTNSSTNRVFVFKNLCYHDVA